MMQSRSNSSATSEQETESLVQNLVHALFPGTQSDAQLRDLFRVSFQALDSHSDSAGTVPASLNVKW